MAEWIGLLALGLVNLVLLLWLVFTRGGTAQTVQAAQAINEAAQRSERELKRQIDEAARANRQELSQALALFQDAWLKQSQEAQRTSNAQLEGFAQRLGQLQSGVSEALVQQLQALSEANARRQSELRATLEAQLSQLQQTNVAKLDEMRQTVDEKLQNTLEARLGASFKQVADRLEQVHKGLGEMQGLAQGVGDLKHLLSNVKSRGTFGETQLGALLEQALTVEQYAAQVPVKPGSREVVDYAVRLPGRAIDGAPVWLPIDAKFPTEDYERLLLAQQQADAAGVEAAGRGLEARIRSEARLIAEKYIAPPHTTDFAILFLPAEGLYAEVLRRPGLIEVLQRQHHIMLAGPTTLFAMLNSLQMGFRTLAIEQRSAEVRQLLSAVKTEFGKFGEVLSRVKSQTETVLNTLNTAEVRTRAMGRALRQVEALPDEQTKHLLPPEPGEGA